MFKKLIVFIILGLFSAPVFSKERIVTIGAAVSEIVTELGFKDSIIGVDSSSSYPASLRKEKKIVGYWKKISAEGVLSLRPTMVIASEFAGPDYVLEQIEKSGVPVYRVKETASLEGTKDKIIEIGKILKATNKASKMNVALDKDFKIASKDLKTKSKKKALFLIGQGGGAAMAAGAETSIDTALKYAQLDNAVEAMTGFKPLSSEMIIQSNPDIIFVPEFSLKAAGGVEGLKKLPGVAFTNAAKNNAIYSVDAALIMGFGPRLGKAIQNLVCLSYQECQESTWSE